MHWGTGDTVPTGLAAAPDAPDFYSEAACSCPGPAARSEHAAQPSQSALASPEVCDQSGGQQDPRGRSASAAQDAPRLDGKTRRARRWVGPQAPGPHSCVRLRVRGPVR